MHPNAPCGCTGVPRGLQTQKTLWNCQIILSPVSWIARGVLLALGKWNNRFAMVFKPFWKWKSQGYFHTWPMRVFKRCFEQVFSFKHNLNLYLLNHNLILFCPYKCHSGKEQFFYDPNPFLKWDNPFEDLKFDCLSFKGWKKVLLLISALWNEKCFELCEGF